jgi:hypothetical protein
LPEHFHRSPTPPPFEQPPPTIIPAAEQTALGRLVRLVGRPLWAWRLELATVAGIFGGFVLLAVQVGRVAAALVVCGLGATWACWPRRWRAAALALFHRAQVRRRWALAARYAHLATHNDRIPRPVRIHPVPAGDVLSVRVPAGANTAQLAEQVETIAASLEVREVRVTRDPDNARYALVTIVRRDPLATPTGPWPQLSAASLSVWAPIPVGRGEDGQPISLSLPERNVLIGGEPGAGKSVGLSMLVASAALDPTCELYLFDGKWVELAPWAGCAARLVGPNLDQAAEVLAELRGEMDDRYLALLANRRRKLDPGVGLGLRVVVIDELALYLNAGERRKTQVIAELLRDLVSRGRAAGIIVLAATQKPSADVIPTFLRDLFSIRWAFRCSTPQASDTVLGQGWAAAGHSASTIDLDRPGVGLLLHEGRRPVRLRTFYLDDADLLVLARRAEALRANYQRQGAEPGSTLG